MIRTSCTVREEDLEDAYDVLLPALPQGVHENPAADGRVELSWNGPRVDLGALAADWREEEGEARRKHGWVVADRLVVRAPDAPPGPPGLPEVVVQADHGQFGTGAHPTTRDSLELLLMVEPVGAFADLGCGAGVLAIGAARLGFAPVVAVDFEPGSVRMTRENAARNGVQLTAHELDLQKLPPPPAATVAANLPLAVHRVIAPQLAAEHVIVSGVVSTDAGEIPGLYTRYRTVRAIETAGWTTSLLERA